MEHLKVKWNQEISESAEVNGEFRIKGVAINETTTSNGHKFLAEELQSSAGSLMGVPLLKDHENMIDNIVGRVTNSFFDSSRNNIQFEAKIMDPKMKEMIKDGRINSVSVGASVEDMDETDEGDLIPRGITFQELSLVAVPADAGATFQVALKEAYKLHSTSNVDKNQLKGGLNMEGEEVKTETPEATPEAAPVEAPAEAEAPVEEPKEEVETVEEPKEDATEKSLKLLTAQVKQLIKQNEAEPEAKAEEPVKAEEPEEADEEAEEEVTEGLKIAESHGSLRGGAFTVLRDYR